MILFIFYLFENSRWPRDPHPEAPTRDITTTKNVTKERKKKNMHLVFTRFPMADRWTSNRRSRRNQGHQSRQY